jgi:hypothetical protein
MERSVRACRSRIESQTQRKNVPTLLRLQCSAWINLREVLGPATAAITNALFDATGVRVREYPLTPARVRASGPAASWNPMTATRQLGQDHFPPRCTRPLRFS